MILNYVISVFKYTRVRRGYTDTKKNTFIQYDLLIH